MIIAKEIKFEAAHVLSDYNGPCANLHGHSYMGVVSIDAPVNEKTHMVVDFNNIKRVVDDYDHAIIFSKDSIRNTFEKELYELVMMHNKKAIVIRDGKCTAEDISMQMARDISSYYGCKARVILRETSSSEVNTGWVEA